MRMAGSTKKWEPINFVFYLSFAKWPVIAAIVVEIGLRLLAANFLQDLSLDRVDMFMWVIRLAAFIFVGWKIGKTYGEVPPMGIIAGAISGLAIGLVMALFRFESSFHIWKVFNIITETTLTVLVGGLMSFLVVYLWDMWPERIK